MPLLLSDFGLRELLQLVYDSNLRGRLDATFVLYSLNCFIEISSSIVSISRPPLSPKRKASSPCTLIKTSVDRKPKLTKAGRKQARKHHIAVLSHYHLARSRGAGTALESSAPGASSTLLSVSFSAAGLLLLESCRRLAGLRLLSLSRPECELL